MLLLILAFMTLLFIVVLFLILARLIFLVDQRDKQYESIIKKFTMSYNQVVEFSQLLFKLQNDLDDKMSALSTFVDERNTYVTFQQEQFKILAKSDMLKARREELLSLTQLKVVLERFISMSTMSRQPPAPIDVLALKTVTSRIDDLEKFLNEDF